MLILLDENDVLITTDGRTVVSNDEDGKVNSLFKLVLYAYTSNFLMCIVFITVINLISIEVCVL